MYLIIIILQDLKHIPALLEAWQKIGVPGGTILHSAGFFHTASWLSKIGLGGLERIVDNEETKQRTLLLAVDSDEFLEKVTVEAERVVGGFNKSHSGLLLVVPILSAKGMVKLKARTAPDELPAYASGSNLSRHTQISKIPPGLVMRPTVIAEDTLLDAAAREMIANPNVQVAAVTNQDNRLVGVLDIRTLADDLFFHIYPEEFLSNLTDLEQVFGFAEKSTLRSAADAMRPAVFVKPNDTVKDAYRIMHENSLTGLLVVDDNYHVTGYINLLTLLSQWLSTMDAPGNKKTERQDE